MSIPSQDPVTRPARTEKLFDEMKLASFHVDYVEGQGYKMLAKFLPYDAETDDIYEEGEVYFLRLDKFEETISNSPKMNAAWAATKEVMGLAYIFYRLQEKKQEAIEAGASPQEIQQLNQKIGAALAALTQEI